MCPRLMEQDLQRRCPGAVITDFKLSDLDDLTKQASRWNCTTASRARRLASATSISPPSPASPATSLRPRSPPASSPSSARPPRPPTTPSRLPARPAISSSASPTRSASRGSTCSYEGKVAPAADGKSLTVEETFKVLTRIIPTEDYAAYRAEFRAHRRLDPT